MEPDVNSSSYTHNHTSDRFIGPDEVTKPPEGIIFTILSIFHWSMFSTGVAGAFGNILTLLVYIKLGFSETIHMSYAALAISDLGCVLSMLSVAFSHIMAVVVPFGVKVDMYLLSMYVGGWPHFAFSRTTALRTSWISLERCLCVVFPTRVKLILTRKVTKAVLSTIYIVGNCPAVFAYIGLKFEMSVDPVSGSTTLLIYRNSDYHLETLHTFALFLYGAVYPVVSWVMVTTCAVFLIAKLNQSAKWRNANTCAATDKIRSSGGKGGQNTFRREVRVTRTVLTVACTFIICSLPISTTIVIPAIWPDDYSIGGSLHFPFLISTGISLLFSEINSSVNIVVYAVTGARFRCTLLQMLPKKRTTG